MACRRSAVRSRLAPPTLPATDPHRVLSFASKQVAGRCGSFFAQPAGSAMLWFRGGLKGEWGMYGRWACAGLAASFSVALAATVSAQQGQDLSPEDQLAPSQMMQPMPGRAANPPGGQASSAASHAPKPVPAAAHGSAKPAAGATLKAVACNGAFSKDSSNLKLAIMFDQQNVTYNDITVNGSSVGASTIYPKDPKRRLEIWWQNPANRSGIYLILINGQSTWAAPGGMKLGQTLADLE